MKTVEVSEIFYSLQGESTHAGRRCGFVRLSGCNLQCTWCDTLYACREGGRTLPLPMVVESLRPFSVDLVEITGGEPLLQPAMPDLAAMLAADGYTVLVETNGSMDISPLTRPVLRIMDFKPPSSGMVAANRMANLVHLRAGDEVKIAIADRTDYDWAKAVIGDADYPGRVVTTLFSPVHGMMDKATLTKWILDDRLPVRLNLQWHKILWPDIDKGV